MIIDPYRFASGGPTFPAYIAHQGTLQITNVTSHPLTMPSGINVGELLLAIVGFEALPTVTIDTGASGVNWTPIVNLGGIDTTHVAYWKIAAGSDALTLTSSSGVESAGYVIRISGAVSVSGSVAEANGNPGTFPSHTPPGGTQNYLWITAWSINDTDSSGVSTPATGFTTIAQQASHTSPVDNNSGQVGFGTRNLQASTLSPGTFSTGASTNQLASTLAVSPT